MIENGFAFDLPVLFSRGNFIGNFVDKFKPIKPLSKDISGGNEPEMARPSKSIPTTVLVSAEQIMPSHKHSSLPPLVNHVSLKPKLKASVAKVQIWTVLASETTAPKVPTSSADRSHSNACDCVESRMDNRSDDSGEADTITPAKVSTGVTGAAVIGASVTGVAVMGAGVAATGDDDGPKVGVVVSMDRTGARDRGIGATDGTSLLTLVIDGAVDSAENGVADGN